MPGGLSRSTIRRSMHRAIRKEGNGDDGISRHKILRFAMKYLVGLGGAFRLCSSQILR